MNLLPAPNFESIGRDCAVFTKVLKSILPTEALTLTPSKISNVLFLRSLVGYAVFQWVFEDPFPIFGTEDGPIWDELKIILEERG